MLAWMHSGDLTREQAEKLHEQIAPLASYLYKLQKRMDDCRFSHADRLYWEVVSARYATQLLVDHLHRIRCGPAYVGKE